VSRFQFVADHTTPTSARPGWSVKRLCALLDVQRSSFYAWKAAAPARAARAAADTALAARIRTVHAQDTSCGRPRITAELNDGAPAERRVMRAHDIHGYRRRRRVRTTIPEQTNTTVPDLLGRDFTAAALNRVYVGDITYLPLANGANLYLATVIDCYSRRLTGWAIAEHMRTDLVTDALRAAAGTRGSLAGAIFHSDHGSVYTSRAYAALCDELEVTQSMGAVGSSADNALAESFNATLKREVLQDTPTWPDAPTCRRQLFGWLNRYNTRRRHSWCRYQTPNAYEKTYTATVRSAA
jgi:transposase InsO family protein